MDTGHFFILYVLTSKKCLICLKMDACTQVLWFFQLINMSPKAILRLPEARSSFDEMIGDTEFQRIIPETGIATEKPQGVQKLVFCTGKVYYEIAKTRKVAEKEHEVAVVRVEQVSLYFVYLILLHVVIYNFLFCPLCY